MVNRNKFVRKKQSLLFNLLKAFNQIESTDSFVPKDLFSFMRAQHALNFYLIKNQVFFVESRRYILKKYLQAIARTQERKMFSKQMGSKIVCT